MKTDDPPPTSAAASVAGRSTVRLTPLAMAILLLLAHEPMHPYGLRQRLQEWDKDRVINVSQRNAVYYTIDRLRSGGLITLRETERQDNRPDRSVYEATSKGIEQAERWLTRLIATPMQEYPSFPAALAFLQSLPPEASVAALEQRVVALESQLRSLDAHVESQVAKVPGGVDRIYLVEVEYQQTMWRAETAWVQQLIDDIRAGRAWVSAEGERPGPGSA